MVSFREEESLNVLGAVHSETNGRNSRRVQMQVIGVVACVTLLAAAVFLTAGERDPAVLLEKIPAKTQKLYDATTFDQLSGDLLGGLEKAMDNSVDNKVRSFMAAPSLAAVPVPHVSVGYHRLLPFDPHPYVTQTQLERLLAEKRELEGKREAILRTLRMKREAAAAKAAKDAAELDQVRLERAVTDAKKRQLEQAQRAARAAASKMREAAIAKKLAIHAAAVAAARQRELDSLSESSSHDALEADAAEGGDESAKDLQSEQDKSAVDSKLKSYLAQERELLHKISAAEKVAAHGGEWPSEGLPVSQAQPKQVFNEHPAAEQKSSSTQQLRQLAKARRPAVHHKKSIEGEVIDSIVKALKENKEKIQEDKVETKNLHDERVQLIGNMRDLRSADRRLTKELVHAELANHKDQ